MQLSEYMEKTAEEVDKTLHRFYGDVFGDLHRASAHLLLAGGKRLRPVVTLLAADAVKKGSGLARRVGPRQLRARSQPGPEAPGLAPPGRNMRAAPEARGRRGRRIPPREASP